NSKVDMLRPRRGGGSDLHGSAVLEPLLPRGDDGRVGREAREDLDLAGTPLADLDFGQDRLSVLDPKDEIAVPAGYNGGLRHDDGVLADIDDDRDAGEKTGIQPAIGIGDAGAQADRPSAHIDQRVD